MQIVMAASEASPWIKTGGLADVLEALPKAITEKRGNRVSLFLPYYKSIKQGGRFPTVEVCRFYIPLGWRNAYVGVMKLSTPPAGINVYFIDNDDYFNRDNPYGYYDDGERFAFFSSAVLYSCIRLGVRPEIFHCHDWQTALIPLLLKACHRSQFPDTKTVLTIHNLEYQGFCESNFLGEVLGLGEEWRDTITFDGMVNFLKTGIETADAVTTVSKSYAKEIMTPEIGGRLADLLSRRAGKISGIVNGINMDLFNPETCKDIAAPFNAESYTGGKAAAKAALCRECGLSDSNAPVLGLVSRLAGHKGIDVLCDALEELLPEYRFSVAVCGSGEPEYERRLTSLAEQYPGRVFLYLGFHPTLANRIYAGCDIYMMPSRSEPCGLSQLIAMRFGAVPVVHCVGGLRDTVIPYDAAAGTGRGFLFESSEGGAFAAALKEALRLYRNPVHWTALCQNNMREDFSWSVPAAHYLALYESLCRS